MRAAAAGQLEFGRPRELQLSELLVTSACHRDAVFW